MNLRIGLVLTLFITVIGQAGDRIAGTLTRGEGGFTLYTYTNTFANTYLLERDGRLLMIDAGLPGDSTGILAFLAEQGLQPESIDLLVLTHAHPDHAGNAAYFQRRFNVPVLAGSGERHILASGGYDKHLCSRGLTASIVEKTIASRRYTPFVPDVVTDTVCRLDDWNWSAEVVPCRSHTSGSLIVKVADMAFVGDLIRGKNLRPRKPASHLFICDRTENLREITALASEDRLETWHPGHGGPLARRDILKFIEKNR